MTREHLDANDEELGNPADLSGDDFSTRLVRRFLRLCESPLTRDRMLRMVRASVADASSAQRFHAFVNKRMNGMLGRRRKVQVSTSRAELVGSQLIGLAMLRYVLEVDPVASMSRETLVPMAAAGVRGVLRSDPGFDEPTDALDEPLPDERPDATELITGYRATGRPL
ncbi:hypothetical protein ncot_09665 [Nocardioides sp. JQ2195]|uniref:TetR/AcrR family transcriptional regulator n=1 Tax=Nocardioides sp. JQ2195 TaxID=2592334 RepID=UPI00143E82B3|nr:hypothetical protein [Nocardioides sp. JQ2195]QIX26840.1 hypothetical protein ncot_09665 [Nocardioides sp. JQ2195]